MEKATDTPFRRFKRSILCLYLCLFNIISTAAWIRMLLVVGQYCRDRGLHMELFYEDSWPIVSEALTLAQSLAFFDILHALLGFTRSSVATTAVQVFSRVQLVLFLFPKIPQSRAGWPLLGCIWAWTFAEILRYPFFAIQQLLQFIDIITQKESNPLAVPFILKWLRYSGFIILYPIGISSEVVCMWSGLDSLKSSDTYNHYPYPMPNTFNFEINVHHLYIGILLGYIPGSIQLYRHMLRQRSKYLYGADFQTKKNV